MLTEVKLSSESEGDAYFPTVGAGMMLLRGSLSSPVQNHGLRRGAVEEMTPQVGQFEKEVAETQQSGLRNGFLLRLRENMMSLQRNVSSLSCQI